MSKQKKPSAARTYMRDMFIAMLLYTAAIFGVSWIANNNPPAEPWIYLLALIPMLPTALVFLAMIRFFRRMDELQQRMIGEATVIAAAAVGFASFAYGLMVSYADLPEIPMVWVLPALFASYGVAIPFVRARYQ